MTRSQGTILGLSLATFLALAPLASAAPQATTEPRAVLSHLWGLLTSLWTGGSTVDNGCSYDPSGGHCSGAASTQGTTQALDNGCSFDPNGGHCSGAATPSTTQTLDAGCSFDPDGHCLGGR
jgi:hypothetical protein